MEARSWQVFAPSQSGGMDGAGLPGQASEAHMAPPEGTCLSASLHAAPPSPTQGHTAGGRAGGLGPDSLPLRLLWREPCTLSLPAVGI